MPRFPQEENNIIALAQKVANGISINSTVFAHPPVTATQMLATLSEYLDKTNEVQLAKAYLMQKIHDKNDLLEQITDAARRNIDYGVVIANGDNALLEQIGWGERAAPTSLQPPGQCRALEILLQGEAWVRVDWKEPADGGKVAAYKILRSEDGASFTDAATVTESEAAMFNQPIGKRLTYQVVAINKAGEGMASNTISLVL